MSCVLKVVQVRSKRIIFQSQERNWRLDKLMNAFNSVTLQLVKICDGLAPHLATGIIQLVTETQSTGIIKEILREVDRATPEEAAAKNIATFMEAIATAEPELMLPAIDNLTDHLTNDVLKLSLRVS